MTHFVVGLLLLATSTAALAADGRAFPSPEAALDAYESARIRKDIPAVLASINFRQEAIETLQRSGRSIVDAEVDAIATTREADLRQHLEKRGFTGHGKCETVKKFQDSAFQVRFMLSCKDATGGTFFPVRVMRDANGWLVVRGG